MLDADSADFRVMQNAYINLKDFRFGPTAGKGFSDQLTSVGGTAEVINEHLPTGQNFTIGTATDFPNRRAVFFVWNSNGNHTIYCLDYFEKFVFVLLQNSQVTGGLNFDKNKLIHSARIENGCVYWTDNLNEPRRININSGIGGNLIFGAARKIVGNNRTFTFAFSAAPVNSHLSMSHTSLAGGSNGVETVPLNWTNFPATSIQQIVVNGITSYFTEAGSTGYSLVIPPNNTIILSIGVGFIWPSGVNGFNTGVVTLQFVPQNSTPYAFPVSQSVISWIRRQPGVAPGQTKQVQNSPVVPVNQIANEAFLFAYRYVYRDFELSTLSGWSYLANFNSTDQQFNRIAVFIPFNETIDQDVVRIDLVAQYMLSGISFIINTWRKNVPADLAAINAHNAGTVPLTYLFYNDQTGIALDIAYANKIFDSVPLLAQTIEMAKNRSFMANYTIGYASPITSSLRYATTNITYNSGGGGVKSGEWFLLKFTTFRGVPNQFYVLRSTFAIGPLAPQAFYYYTWSGAAPPFPASLNAPDLTYRGFDAQSTAEAIHNDSSDHVSFATLTDQGAASIISGAAPPVVGFLGRAFKSYASYQLSISFKDNSGRECGIYTTPQLVVTTPDPISNGILTAYTFVNAINWTLSNTGALSEIPDWAYYYSINITKCLRTRFFIQGIGLIVYAAKDNAGNYTFNTTAYDSSLAGVAINLLLLQSNAQGYVLAQGDIVRLLVNGTYHNLSIIGQSAQYIICQLENVGALIAVSGNFEIFTPYKKLTDEPYFEIGQIIPINNPTTNQRTYSSLSGTISGDITVLQRISATFSYITEAMSPNDKFYTRWFTDAGRPDFLDYIGQTIKTSSIAFSDTYIPGAQNNGLSTYNALDTQDISPDFGPIAKLQLASKVSKIGTVMLAICEGMATASIYLGENTLISQTGDAVIAQANTVIGSIHELKGGFGTLNPESVFEFRGNIYWFDVQNGMIVQYADNGLYPISNYKMSRFWKLFADIYKSLGASAIEAFGSRPFVFGGLDPYNGELLWTVPRVLAAPANGYLPDYPDTYFLPVNNINPIHIGGENTYVFTFPNNPTPPYGSSLQVLFIAKTNKLGEISTLPISINFNKYPSSSAAQIMVDGIFQKFTPLGVLGTDWSSIATTPTTVSIFISPTWDWGTGDQNQAATSIRLLFNPPVDNGNVINRSIPFPFDIYDGQAKTLVYKLYTDPNHWQGSYSFEAENMFCLENNLFTFKNGKLYLHNQDNQCQYYGVQYQPAVMNISNQQPTKPKSYNNFASESNQQPVFVYVMSLYPYVQSSDLDSSDFENLEGIWYAPIYRNKLDPAFGNNYPYALISGEKMRTTALYAMSQWNATTGIVSVKFINLGYTLSIGQKV